MGDFSTKIQNGANKVFGTLGLKKTDNATEAQKNDSANQAQKNQQKSSLSEGESHKQEACPAGSAQPNVDMATAGTVGAAMVGTMVGGVFGGVAAGVAANKILTKKDKKNSCDDQAPKPLPSPTDSIKSGLESAGKTVGEGLNKLNKVVMEFVEAAKDGMRVPANNVQDVYAHVKKSDNFTKEEKGAIKKFMADLNAAGPEAKQRIDNYLKNNGFTEGQLHKIAENKMSPAQVLDGIKRGDGGV